MADKKIDQKEYLKRYLSKKDDKKKKKKKIKIGPKKVQIIDDDIDFKKLTTIDDEEISIFNATEDAPQIVGIIDERGPVDFDNKQRWKVIADDGTGDIAIQKVGQSRNEIQDELIHRASANGEQGSKADKTEKKSKEKSLEKRKKHMDNSSNSDCSGDERSRNNNKTELSKKKMTKKNSEKRNKDSDSDMSPPRDSNRKESRSKTTSKRRQDSDSDLSPPRPNNKKNESLTRNRRSQSQDSDLSPPRPSKSNDNSKSHKSTRHDDFSSKSKTISKSSKTKNKSDSDLSPPRPKKSQQSKDSDGYDSDLSLPRNNKSRKDTHSRNRKTNYDSDLSPPRSSKQERHKRDQHSDRRLKSRWDDHSKTSQNSEQSRASSLSSKYSDSRSGLPRYNDTRKSRSPSQRLNLTRKSDGRSTSPASSVASSQTRKKKMLDGRSAGLTNLQTLMEEDKERKRREEEQLRNMSREESGRGQETIVRGRKRRDLEQNAAEQRERQKEQDEINEKYAKWGKGLKQGTDRENRLKSDLHEMNKPMARYADDVDLERDLRAAEREDDPMLMYVREKQIKEGKRVPVKIKYEGSYMPNRFGIKPGYRWDGVDRSNGYENKWFEAQNTKKAVAQEAYEYLTADM